MLTIAQIERYYSYFFNCKYNTPRNKFKATKTTTSVCESFLKIIDSNYSLVSIGNTFLWEYFLFQFQYWHELELKNSFHDKVPIAWIVGKKAFQRWIDRNKDYDWQIETYPIVKAYSLNKNDLIDKEQEKPKNKSVLFDSSKAIRKRFLNTKEGFAICVQQTTLFDPSDTSCIRCNSRSECKELLRVNIPSIYQQRIKDRNKIAMETSNGV